MPIRSNSQFKQETENQAQFYNKSHLQYVLLFIGRMPKNIS